MAFQYDELGRAINPLTGMPIVTSGTTQGFGVTETPGISATVTGSTQQPAAPQPASGPPSYSDDPDAWVDFYYPGYDNDAGVTTIGTGVTGSGGRTSTITHTKSTPETHPWLYINPDEVDVNGMIYGAAPTRTETGYTAGRMATDAERQASYDSNNYFKTGEGLNPELLEAMTRYITPGQAPGNTFTNEFGTYTQQHAIIDQARARLGLDPWTEIASGFSGVDQSGNPVNYRNEDSLWGNRGPGLSGLAETLATQRQIHGEPVTRPGSSTPGGSTPGGSVPGGSTPGGFTPGTGGGSTNPPRTWNNSGGFIDRSTRPGNYAEMYGNAPGASGANPAMEALRAAMMNAWGN